MKIDRLDHFVLTMASVEATCDFYVSALGMAVITFGEGRKALTFGEQKINLHQAGAEFLPKAEMSDPGQRGFLLPHHDIPLTGRDFTFGKPSRISIEEGPVARTGATGPIRSIYLRDPDGNLLEISNRIVET